MFNDYSIINPNRYKDVMPKNACKVGVIGKKMYVVCLSIERVTTTEGVNETETMVVHNLRTFANEEIERVEGDLARRIFNKMLFY